MLVFLKRLTGAQELGASVWVCWQISLVHIALPLEFDVKMRYFVTDSQFSTGFNSFLRRLPLQGDCAALIH